MKNIETLYKFPVDTNSSIGISAEGSEYMRKVLCRQDNLPPDTQKSLEQCALDINRLDQSSFDNTLVMGEILSYVKKSVAPRGFAKWVKEHTKISHRTANNAMILYRITLGHPELLSLDRSIIYNLGTKEFTNEAWKLLADTGVGCYKITSKGVLQLKIALRNGEIKPNSIDLDEFFKKREDINVDTRLKTANEKLIRTLMRQRKEYEDFITQQSEIAGKKFENRFTQHSRFIMKALDDTIAVINRGPDRATSAVPMITYQPQLQIETNTIANEPPLAIDNIQSRLEQPVEPSKKYIEPCISKTDLIAGENEIDPCNSVKKGEAAIPDEILVSSCNFDFSEIACGCGVQEGNEDMLDEALAEACEHSRGDYLVEEAPKKYEEVLCQDDFLECYEEVEN